VPLSVNLDYLGWLQARADCRIRCQAEYVRQRPGFGLLEEHGQLLNAAARRDAKRVIALLEDAHHGPIVQ